MPFFDRGNVEIIFAGPLRHKDEVGGVVFLFEDLLESIGPTKNVFDTNTKNYIFPVFMILSFVWRCIGVALKGNEVALHGSIRDYKYLGFILLIFHKSLGLRYHTRKFGGSFNEAFASFATLWRWTTMKFLQHSRVNYFETQELLEYFAEYNSETFWLPNYRPVSNNKNSESFQGRFIFVGHVKREKGLDEILALGPLLPKGWLVDIYGPLIGYKPEEFSASNICYQGVLRPECVVNVIANYNVLLLPTFHEGEGYPGVVLEAYSVNAPVVATRWRALPEIVNESCGALIEPHNTLDLLRGMRDVAKDYRNKRIGASTRFMAFSRDVVLNNYLSKIGLTKNCNP